jgi:uncharacterized membrane protein YheB (UPF0754 family)
VGFIELIQSDYTVLLIPVISAFIGWFTNWLAVQMMFYPNDFVGIPPFLGWQGIVPASAERLARFSTRLITTKLLSLEELFQNFKGDAFASEMDAVVDQITEQILQEVAQKHAKVMWENAGEVMQNMVRQKLREEVRTVVINITDDFSNNITKILDLEQVVLDAVMKNRRLMTMMFLEVGEAEFKFIIRSGIWFGFLFGIPQMIIWVYWPAVWVLPFFGFLVGYATNWIALKLVFEPKRPVKIGPFVLQGLFHKRQDVVAERFSELTAGHLLNAENIVRTVTEGESGKLVLTLVKGRVEELIGKYEQHPMAAMMLPEGQRAQLRTEVYTMIEVEIPRDGGLLHTFAAKAVDIRGELHDRMKALDSESFEGVLRPAFQQDEWKLILAGAVLGLAAGVAQLVWMFGDTLAG